MMHGNPLLSFYLRNATLISTGKLWFILSIKGLIAMSGGGVEGVHGRMRALVRHKKLRKVAAEIAHVSSL
jgi:hypothetical protein